MKRLAAVFGSRHRSGQSDVASHQDDASAVNDDASNDDLARSKHAHLARPKSTFFRSLSRRAQPPAAPLITPQVFDGSHLSSSSSSSAGPSTPDDDARSFVRSKTWLYPPNAVSPTQTTVHVQASLIVPQVAGIGALLHAARIGLTPGCPHAQVEHESDGESSASEFSRSSAHTSTLLSQRTRMPMSNPTPPAVPSKPLSAIEYTRAVANNGLAHSFSPPPLLHVPYSPLFPRSCNTHSQVASLASDSVRVQLFHKRVLACLSQPSRADERALQPFTGKRQPPPRGPQLFLDDNAVSGQICLHSEGLRRWVDRPCFEDRLVVYRPAEEGELCEPEMNDIVCVPISGTPLGVAALELSEHLENLAGLYDDLTEDTTFTADTETDAATEITLTLTASPTAELPKAKDIPTSIEFPRKMSQDMRAAPALSVDVGMAGLGELIDFGRTLNTDSLPPPLLTITPTSATPSLTPSGQQALTGSVPSATVASSVPDVKESVKADAGSGASTPPQSSGKPRFSRLSLRNASLLPCARLSNRFLSISSLPVRRTTDYLIFTCSQVSSPLRNSGRIHTRHRRRRSALSRICASRTPTPRLSPLLAPAQVPRRLHPRRAPARLSLLLPSKLYRHNPQRPSRLRDWLSASLIPQRAKARTVTPRSRRPRRTGARRRFLSATCSVSSNSASKNNAFSQPNVHDARKPRMNSGALRRRGLRKRSGSGRNAAVRKRSDSGGSIKRKSLLREHGGRARSSSRHNSV